MAENPGLNVTECSISIACNLPPHELERLIHATGDLNGVGSYIIGHDIGVKGLEKAVNHIEKLAPDRRVIFDPRDENWRLPYEVGHTGFVPDAVDFQTSSEDEDVSSEALRNYFKVIRAAGAHAIFLFLHDPSDHPDNPWLSHEEQEQSVAYQGNAIEIAKDTGLLPIVASQARAKIQFSDRKIRHSLEQAKELGVRNFWLRGMPRKRAFHHYHCLREVFHGENDYDVYIARSFDELGRLRNRAVPALFGCSAYHMIAGEAICNAADQREAAKEIIEKYIKADKAEIPAYR